MLHLVGANYIRACLEEHLIERYEKFMSIDWLPPEETRRFPDHVYTDTCWTRTVKGHLWDRRKDLEHLYQMFDLFKENSRVLAEGNFYFRGHTKLKLSSFEEICTGELSPTLAIIIILHNMAFVMVCFHFPTPIPMPIPIPIRIQMANIITCRTLSTEPIPIPIQITILMQMGTAPNLTQISLLIMWFLK